MKKQTSENIDLLDLKEIARGLDNRVFSSVELVNYCLKKIEIEDKYFNAIAFKNPDSESLAKKLDSERCRGYVRGPLHGIPLVVKDNIDTADSMMTTAGSLALDGMFALKDAHLISRLREGGAIIIGKSNLSEWANFRSTRSSSGWSSRGGQVRNAYAIDRTPGGSSSGSGVAVARGFCFGAIGTETDGSIVGPSSMNSIVGIKPTVGRVSRSGIIPIAHSQDTAGPMAKNVADAATILDVISGYDKNDAATAFAAGKQDPRVSDSLDAKALRGRRIGVVRNFAGFHEGVDDVFEDALKVLTTGGAEIIDNIRLADQTSIRKHELLVMRTEFKVGLNAYLSSLPSPSRVGSLKELIGFNEEHAREVMPYFQQEHLIAAEATNGLEDLDYNAALDASRRLTRDEGIDRALLDHKCSVLIAPTSPAPWSIDLINGDNRIGGSSCLAAVSGYPSVTVPMGYVSGLPVGISFVGKAWEDPLVVNIAYAFEQLALIRRDPGPPSNFLS